MPVNDKDLQEVKKVIDEYEINPNTIRYYSSAKHFFRAFTPKIVGSSLLTVATGAVAVAGALTGGLGVIPIALSGAASFSGFVATTVLGADAARTSRARLEQYDLKAAIAVIMDDEEEALYQIGKLEELKKSGKKTIKLKDGSLYNKSALKSLIKENEKRAYQGVKYLMSIAKKNTEELNKLNNMHTLTKAQGAEKEDLMRELELIGHFIPKITSKRNDVNPYKNLIVNALHNGYRIGRNDYENEQIKMLPYIDKFHRSQELYFKMYEKDLLTKNPPIKEEDLVNEEVDKTKKTDKPKNKSNTQKRSLKEKGKSLPERLIVYMIGKTKTGRILLEKEAEYDQLAEELEETQNKLEYAQDLAYDEYQRAQDATKHWKKATKKVENVVHENKDLQDQLELAQDEAYDQYLRANTEQKQAIDARKQLNEQSNKIANLMKELDDYKNVAEGLLNYGADLENKKEDAEKGRELAQDEAYDQYLRANSAESKLAGTDDKIKQLEEAQTRLLHLIAETNGQLDEALAKGKISEEVGVQLLNRGAELENLNEAISKKLARETAKHEKASQKVAQFKKEKAKETDRANDAETRAEALKGEVIAQNRERNNAVANAESERSRRQDVEKKLADAKRTIDGQADQINTFVKEQGENVQTIIGLTEDKKASEETIRDLENSYNRTMAQLYEVAKERDDERIAREDAEHKLELATAEYKVAMSKLENLNIQNYTNWKSLRRDFLEVIKLVEKVVEDAESVEDKNNRFSNGFISRAKESVDRAISAINSDKKDKLAVESAMEGLYRLHLSYVDENADKQGNVNADVKEIDNQTSIDSADDLLRRLRETYGNEPTDKKEDEYTL